MDEKYQDRMTKYNEIKKSYEETNQKIEQLQEEFRSKKKEKNDYSIFDINSYSPQSKALWSMLASLIKKTLTTFLKLRTLLLLLKIWV